MTRRPLPDLVAQRPQPVINPMALEMEPDGPRKRALEVSHSRVLLGASLFAVVFLVIAVRLVAVTLLPDGADTAVAAPVKIKTADRADIVDRNGVVLATSLTTASLYANPTQVQDPDDYAAQLNAVLPDLNIASTAAKLDSQRGFVWLKRNLTPRQQQAVNRLGLPGIYFQAETKRVYPQGNLTAHLIGFADVDSRGLAGVEKSFDDLLQGGERPLQLSIDVRVQHILHEELSRAIADFHGIGGAGVIMDLKTGEVLSLVSLPDFDPARPGDASDDTRFDRATLGLYEMGSTFKIFNTAIALDSGSATLADGFDASKPIKIGGYRIDDYHGKYRFLSIPEIFTYSSNIG
ncbi:MAG TPA: penicillin-binding transpeptidase domain-containing protein, partial [Dongiaceae bacterium]|nr:penicillin-binding transpeptidase domain-containing protein [Dongiaceae bacterium]